MSVKKKPEAYITSDGREFPDEKQALKERADPWQVVADELLPMTIDRAGLARMCLQAIFGSDNFAKWNPLASLILESLALRLAGKEACAEIIQESQEMARTTAERGWSTMMLPLLDRAGASSIPCHDCRGPVVEFSVPNDAWNTLIRRGGRETDQEYLCLSCFAKRSTAFVKDLRTAGFTALSKSMRSSPSSRTHGSIFKPQSISP